MFHLWNIGMKKVKYYGFFIFIKWFRTNIVRKIFDKETHYKIKNVTFFMVG